MEIELNAKTTQSLLCQNLSLKGSSSRLMWQNQVKH